MNKAFLHQFILQIEELKNGRFIEKDDL